VSGCSRCPAYKGELDVDRSASFDRHGPGRAVAESQSATAAGRETCGILQTDGIEECHNRVCL